jgi:type VI secretion system protein ImpM
VSASAQAVGVFGKLPGLGDFVERGLDPAFTHTWHGWLARELQAARATLGEGFAPAYLQAPAWRFALGPGIAGRGTTGVFVPSLDRVGRPFPLALAAAADAPAAASWYDALEALARAALNSATWALDPWLAALAELPAPEAAGVATGAMFWGEGSPFVAPGERRFATLPEGEGFLRLLLDPGRVAA